MRHTPSVWTFTPQEWRTTLAQEDRRSEEIDWSSRLASGVESHGDIPLVAEMGDEPIGLAWGRIESATPHLAHLYQMWVSPNHRGLGAGKKLLDAVIAWARAANVSYLALNVTCDDSPALRLYLRAGFQPIGAPEPLRPASDLLAQPMRLALTAAA